MYDSSFPTPFPLPQPEPSHSLGSRNTECKHFFPARGNATVFWSLQKPHCRQMSIFTLLGDEIRKSWNGKTALKFSHTQQSFVIKARGLINLVLLQQGTRLEFDRKH